MHSLREVDICCRNSTMGSDHRIIDERIEKSIKGRRIGHNLHFCNEECLSRQEMDTKGGWSKSKGRVAGPVMPWCTLRPPPFPTPGQAWGTYVVFGCCRAGTTARANALTQNVRNSSSLYTLLCPGALHYAPYSFS